MEEALSKFKSKFLDKLLSIESNEGRKIIGLFKSIDNWGNIYLIQTVEVFNKSSDKYSKNWWYENCDEHSFYFDSEINHYQWYNNVIVPMKEIKRIKALKQAS